jgi:hypothetical protein
LLRIFASSMLLYGVRTSRWYRLIHRSLRRST